MCLVGAEEARAAEGRTLAPSAPNSACSWANPRASLGAVPVCTQEAGTQDLQGGPEKGEGGTRGRALEPEGTSGDEQHRGPGWTEGSVVSVLRGPVAVPWSLGAGSLARK